MLDLLQRDLGQIGVIPDIRIAPREMGRRHGDDLFVHPGIVLHHQRADGPDIDDTAGNELARIADQDIDRIAVLRQGMRHEPVIPRIGHRRIQKPVHHQNTRILVELVFDRLAADRHFDDDVNVVRRGLADGDRFDTHGAGVPSLL